MNQQRSRRFRSSKEREALLADYVAKEGKLPDQSPFDSNCITPGTEFMYKLGIAFRRWIDYKMESDIFWKNGAEIGTIIIFLHQAIYWKLHTQTHIYLFIYN